VSEKWELGGAFVMHFEFNKIRKNISNFAYPAKFSN
jgi:hypothetical protein